MRNVTLLFFLLVFAGPAFSADYLFRDGRSDYSIVVSPDASASERTAAAELQYYVNQVGNVELPVVGSPQPGGRHVYVGYDEALGRLIHAERPADDDESFTYRTVGHDLFIYGGSQRGTMYGVFSFLEQRLGVRWYTSDFTRIPKLSKFKLGQLSHTEHPTIGYRFDYYYQAVRDRAWMAHNLLNTTHSVSDGKYGRFSSYWGSHTFGKLIPASDYFASHPEYFGVYKGKRSENTQLCLSNNEMCNELIRNLKKVISEKPGYWCYDVSQNDNSFPCECAECAELVRRYGGQSGAILWFVNKVAAEIGKAFPDVLIGTLAYRYTRQAPTSEIRPAANVVIRLCDIECCMAHPLNECEQNKAFWADLTAWKLKTGNICIWDYTTGFQHYLLPFPNFGVLAANFQFFSQNNAVGILELGSYDAPWSEFSELKQWMIAKLLWNPKQDTDSLASLFISDYYGAAARYVQRYYELCRKQVTDDTHFTIKVNWKANLYTDRFVADASKLLAKAASASSDDETRRRVDRLVAQIAYLQLRQHPTRSFTDGTAQKLVDIVRRDSTIVREHGYDIDKLIDETGYQRLIRMGALLFIAGVAAWPWRKRKS